MEKLGMQPEKIAKPEPPPQAPEFTVVTGTKLSKNNRGELVLTVTKQKIGVVNGKLVLVAGPVEEHQPVPVATVFT